MIHFRVYEAKSLILESWSKGKARWINALSYTGLHLHLGPNSLGEQLKQFMSHFLNTRRTTDRHEAKHQLKQNEESTEGVVKEF